MNAIACYCTGGCCRDLNTPGAPERSGVNGLCVECLEREEDAANNGEPTTSAPLAGELGTLAELRAYMLEGGVSMRSRNAGAIVTLKNEESGARITFRVTRAWDKVAKAPDPAKMWINYLNGPDNRRDYAMLGMLLGAQDEMLDLELRWETDPETASAKGAAWLVRQINKVVKVGPLAGALPLPTPMKAYHDGRCGRCGALLTDPASVKIGLGPDCRKARGL